MLLHSTYYSGSWIYCWWATDYFINVPVFAWNWKEKITIPLVLEKLSTIIFCDLSQQRSALIFSKDILVHMLLMNKRLFWYGIWIEITVQFSNIKCINTCHPQFYQPAILCLSWWNSALYLPYATVTNAMKQFNEMIPFVNQIMTLFKKSIIRSAIFSIIYHMSYFSVLSTYYI